MCSALYIKHARSLTTACAPLGGLGPTPNALPNLFCCQTSLCFFVFAEEARALRLMKPANASLERLDGLSLDRRHCLQQQKITLFSMAANQIQRMRIYEILSPPSLSLRRYSLHLGNNPPSLHWAAEPKPGDRAKAGGADRDRTGDLMLAKHALSQLSYSPTSKDGGPG